MTQDNPPQEPQPQASQQQQEAPHKPADDQEEVYFHGTPLLRGEIGRLIVTLLIAAILIAIPIAVMVKGWGTGTVQAIVAVVLGVAAVLVVGIPILMTKTMRYRISNYRIDYERGILSKRIDTLELWHVEDIQFSQSLLERVLGVGTITVISRDDTTPQLRMEGLPQPRPLFESLKQRIIAVKRQRGVIKMDVG